MTPYFKQTPISDPPKKDGWYVTVPENMDMLKALPRWCAKGVWVDSPRPGNIHYLAPLAEPVGGMRWRNITDVKPPKDVEVFFDGGENPPVWGRYSEDQSGGYVITMDSSGEEDWEPIENFIRWLDESSTPSAREAELETEVAELKQLMEKKLRRAYTRGWVAKHQQQTRGKQESTEDEEIKAIMEWDGIDKPSPFQNR